MTTGEALTTIMQPDPAEEKFQAALEEIGTWSQEKKLQAATIFRLWLAMDEEQQTAALDRLEKKFLNK